MSMPGLDPDGPDRSSARTKDANRGRWLPAVALLSLLAGATLIAFAAQRSRSGAATDVAPEPPATPASTAAIPVSASYEERLAALETAVSNDPRDTLALAALAELRLASHQPEGAITLLDDWLAVNPASPGALLQKVMTYAAMERWDDAIATNRTLFDLEPSRRLTRLNMGSLFANRGDLETARDWWTALIDEAPDSDEAMAAREALARLGATEPADSQGPGRR